MAGVGVGAGGGSRLEGGNQVVSARIRRIIQSIKEIIGDHSDADIYAVLKETDMDPNETAHKLLTLGNAPSPYLPSTPVGQPMTPTSASYLPGTPGGQPMTPGNVGMDMMSPLIGGEGDGIWYLPDILVNTVRPGEDPHIGVVREVLTDGSCKVALGAAGNGETVIALPTEIEMVQPKKSDRIKILSSSLRGVTGKLIGIDGTDGIVKLDDTYDVKILDMGILAKLAA